MLRPKAILLHLFRRAARAWPRPSGVRRVLLDSRSAMAAGYLEDLRQLLAADPRLRFFKTVRPNLDRADRRRSLALLHCRHLPYRLAKLLPWDLIVLADHPTDQLDDLESRFGVLRITHGIGGKMVNGRDYMYGPALYGRGGRLRYSCIFEASAVRRDKYVAENPALRDIVRLVGDLRLDRLRATPRPAAPEWARPVVVIASSWNEGNLLRKMGPELLAAAAALSSRYVFVVRPHPHYFDSAYRSDWPARLQAPALNALKVSSQEHDLGEAIVPASVVICDDLSSVVLYAAALGKRIILVRSGSPVIAPDSFAARLAALVPTLARAEDLGATIAAVLRTSPSPEVAELAAEINSRPGESGALMSAELYRLVHLPPPDPLPVPRGLGVVPPRSAASLP